MFNKKEDPLVGVISGIVSDTARRNEAERKVNETFGVYSRKALPHERQAEYDAALAQAQSETLKEETELDEEHDSGPDGSGRWKVNFIHPDKKNIGNEKFSSKREAHSYIKDLKRKGYHDVHISDRGKGSMNEEQLDELSKGTLKSYLEKNRKQGLKYGYDIKTLPASTTGKSRLKGAERAYERLGGNFTTKTPDSVLKQFSKGTSVSKYSTKKYHLKKKGK